MYGCIVEPYFSSKNVNNGFSIKIFQPGLFSDESYYKQYKRLRLKSLSSLWMAHERVTWSFLINCIDNTDENFHRNFALGCALSDYESANGIRSHFSTSLTYVLPAWWCWWHPTLTLSLNHAVFDDSSTPKIWYFFSRFFFSHHTDSLCFFLC